MALFSLVDNASKTHRPCTALSVSASINFETIDQYRPANLCCVDKAVGCQLIGQYPEGLRDKMQNRHTGEMKETPSLEHHDTHVKR